MTSRFLIGKVWPTIRLSGLVTLKARRSSSGFPRVAARSMISPGNGSGPAVERHEAAMEAGGTVARRR